VGGFERKKPRQQYFNRERHEKGRWLRANSNTQLLIIKVERKQKRLIL
jgi:hypothetical protein